MLEKKLSEFTSCGSVVSKFGAYLEILTDENRKHNLTAITDADGIIVKHFADSLHGGALITGGAVVDIGSGAGFPALPLAILRPDVSFTLIEATAKKTAFLSMVIRELNLRNATVLTGRAEELAHNPAYREQFDYATSRAVAALNILIELSVPFLKVGGKMLCYKAATAAEELSNAQGALKTLDCTPRGGKEFMLDGQYYRNILVIQKDKETEAAFPRKYKQIQSKPL